MTNVTVIGLGAMGGGMARSLLRSDAVSRVVGFDLNHAAVSKFHEEAKRTGKSLGDAPPGPEKLTLDRFVDGETTDVVLIVLVNEAQCQSVCFDGKDGRNLEALLGKGSMVIVSSTVTPAWSKRAHARFAESGIRFLDCPVSGGPVRALAGEITMMCSGDQGDLVAADPLFQAMGTEIHVVEGGAGMGSTVKMVHQLLAGVHIAVAAEALALAAKAGLDVRQMYEIVRGAAGNSWMFGDRGKRMIEYKGEPDETVMSSLAIFIKDMDIVYSSAKALKCPVPIATAALQQFIGGAGLGLDRRDDSQVVRVYEALSGVSVSASAAASASPAPPPSINESNGVGDVWTFPDGTKETIVDCCDEPDHRVVIRNRYVRVLEARIAAGSSCGAHRHSKHSVFFFLTKAGIDFDNHVWGTPAKVRERAEFGEVRYGGFTENDPLVHKITNASATDEMLCVDAELVSPPPSSSSRPSEDEAFAADHHELVKTREDCRVWKLSLGPGESVRVAYPFFHVSVVLSGSTVRTEVGDDGAGWETASETGDVGWNPPSGGVTIANIGDSLYEQFILEWC